jgi:hypothetical protein
VKTSLPDTFDSPVHNAVSSSMPHMSTHARYTSLFSFSLPRRSRRASLLSTTAAWCIATAFALAPAQTASAQTAETRVRSANANEISINIDGRVVEASPAPVLSSGAVLVPLRGVLEKLGANVRYDASDRRIDITQNNKRAILRVGQNSANVDTQTVPLSAPPQLIGGSAYVPLRALAEVFGYRVQWIGGARTVAIYSGRDVPHDYADHRVALRAGGPLGVVIDFHDASNQEIDALLDAAKSAGAGIIRTRFDWNTLEPTKGAAFQWPIYDRVVRGARERNLIVTGVLGNSTHWASVYARSADANEWRNGAPRDNEMPAWQNYVRRTVGRYRNDVHAWQVWEKPSSDKFRGGRASYRNVVRLAAQAAREADPKAIVFNGEPGGVNLDYIESLNNNGMAGVTDGTVLFPSSQFQPGAIAPPESFLRPFNTLRSSALLRGAGSRDFWVSGLTWPVLGENQLQAQTVSANESDSNGFARADTATRERLLRLFTPQSQADYLLRSSALALAAGSQKAFWGQLRDETDYERVEPINPEFAGGLLRRDFTPRPSYAAFQTLTKLTRDRPYLGALSSGPTSFALLFDNGQSGNIVAWSPFGGTRVVMNMTGEDPKVPGSIYIATRPDTQILDSTGQVVGGPEGTFDLTARPVWITNIAYETRNAVKALNNARGIVLTRATDGSSPDAVRAVFDDQAGVEEGISWRKFRDFRSQARVFTSIGGRRGLTTEISRDVLNPANGRFFIFLDVDDDYLYLNRNQTVEVTVEVHRPASTGDTIFNNKAGFNLQYDVPDGSRYTPWQIVEPGEGWATYTFELPNASFANRGGFDFLINTFGSKQNMVFSSVSVKRKNG